MTPCPLNVRISLIVASIFHISAVYGLIGLCFGYDAPVVSAILSLELMPLSLGLGSTGAPKMTQCTLDVQISLIVTSISYISAVYGPIELCFGYNALIGLCYHNFRAHDHMDWFRGPFLRGHLLRGGLSRWCLLRELLLRGRLFRVCFLNGRLLRGCLLRGGLISRCLSRRCL